MSPNVERYAELTRQLWNARAVGDTKQEGRVLDEMDALWHSITEEERAELNRVDFDTMTAKGRKAWADVPDASAWVEEQRGNIKGEGK